MQGVFLVSRVFSRNPGAPWEQQSEWAHVADLLHVGTISNDFSTSFLLGAGIGIFWFLSQFLVHDSSPLLAK